jgi:signal transduction histidine kinase
LKDGHGSGIGLAEMRERLADLQGDLRVESSTYGTVISATVRAVFCISANPESTGQAVNRPTAAMRIYRVS